MRSYGFFLALLSSGAFAQASAYIDRAFLYLPDAEIKMRVSDQNEFIEYAGEVMDAIEPTITSMPASEPVSFGLIVTVRHGRDSKVWFSIKSGSLSDDQRNRLSTTIEEIRAPDVNYGVVPIAYAVRAWGAVDQVTDVPVAPEWAPHNIEGMPAVDVIEKAWE
jgi:hypothetical protein